MEPRRSMVAPGSNRPIARAAEFNTISALVGAGEAAEVSDISTNSRIATARIRSTPLHACATNVAIPKTAVLDVSKVGLGTFHGMEIELRQMSGARVLRVVHPDAQRISEHRHDRAHIVLFTI